MEKFEINENGCLTAYHNDNKDVSEITVLDGVKSIPDYAFMEYKKINAVMLPDSLESIAYSAFWNCRLPRETSVRSVTYRSVTFSPSFLHMKEIFEMIRDKDYSCVLSHDLKYPVVMQIFFNEGDDVTTAYIKKNFKKFFIFLTDKIILWNKLSCKYDVYNPLEYMQKLIKSGKFISRRNIETYVKIADEKECYSVFDMLNEYREENLT